MAETEKTKKLRLYKFASEYNLATDSLVEFLTEKGYKIKSHMTILSDEMIADIYNRFQKDIEKAEKHYRRISEFQKKYSDKEEPAPAETAEPAAEEVKDSEEGEEVVAEEVEKVEETVPEESEAEVSAEETEAEEAEEIEKEAPEVDTPEKIEKKETVEAAKPFETETEIELKSKKKGLTVVGRIDLDSKTKRKGKTAEKAAGEKPEVRKGDAGQKETVDGEGEDGPKRVKKKVLKAKKKPATTAVDPADEAVKSKKKKKVKRFEIDKKEVEKAIKRTMLSIDESGVGERASFRKKKRKEKQEEHDKQVEQKQMEKNKLKVTEYIAINELANLMEVPVSEVIQKCISIGLMVSINQRLDLDTITLVADEFGFEVEFQEEYTADALEDTPDDPGSLMSRPPVVTIMGHVDHGKTSLLDYIRKANVVAGESGGITQHIGAYKVEYETGKNITFLDTPGHEAFTAMRARGAKVTDIVVLIVAADDAVMPQTVEAINHAMAAGVPIVIAINKIDKPNSNIEKIKQQLAERNVLVEDWGGKYQCVEISAKHGDNVGLLLEKILLEAELLELKANPERGARGTVIESQLDKGRGVTATVLVQKGTLRVGEPFVAGNYHGRVRAMFDERGKKVEEAPPSTPVLVLGFEGQPQAGDTLVAVDSEREAREISLTRQQIKREQDHRQIRLITLDEIANRISQGEVKELPIVVKGDVDGSVEALADSLMKLSNKEVAVKVIHRGVGAISEGDVLLAAASHAIIIGFHVRPNINAKKLAETEKVDIRLYNIIYDAINEVKSALEGMLSPVISEELVGTIEIRETFKVPKLGTVAGCYVIEGKIHRNNKIRLFRDGIAIYEGELSSLKRFKDDVKEVETGYECGLNISNFNDIKIGDVIESYTIVEKKKKLE